MFFLQQVDNFSVSSQPKKIIDKVFSLIQEGLKEQLKILGKLKLYNGLNIIQGRHFVKIKSESYILRILQIYITPMQYDKKYYNEMHEMKGPELLEE